MDAVTGGMTPFTANSAGTGQRIQSGAKVTAIWDADTNSGQKTVIFPTPFAAPPAVVATARRTGWIVTVASISTDTFNINLTNRSASAADGTEVQVDWIAIGT